MVIRGCYDGDDGSGVVGLVLLAIIFEAVPGAAFPFPAAKRKTFQSKIAIRFQKKMQKVVKALQEASRIVEEVQTHQYKTTLFVPKLARIYKMVQRNALTNGTYRNSVIDAFQSVFTNKPKESELEMLLVSSDFITGTGTEHQGPIETAYRQTGRILRNRISKRQTRYYCKAANEDSFFKLVRETKSSFVNQAAITRIPYPVIRYVLEGLYNYSEEECLDVTRLLQKMKQA
jgi:hypothetical protein